jgi:23S rRNA (guanosine2251-2'-O)-methyltransferase
VTAPRRVLGFHPVREALRSDPAGVRRVLVDRGRTGQRRREVEELCRLAGVRVEAVDAGTLSRFAPGVHNGFAAELEPAAAGARHGGDPDFLVLAEDVQDPRNLGALLRVCEGAGVGRVLVREHGSADVSATAVKASAGAAEWLPVERIGSSAQALSALQEEGYWVYGLDMAGEPPWSIDLTGKIVICVGGEQDGLRRLTLERCDGRIGLPMRGRVESLNLATAAAAVLYEAVRQRSESSPDGASALSRRPRSR